MRSNEGEDEGEDGGAGGGGIVWEVRISDGFIGPCEDGNDDDGISGKEGTSKSGKEGNSGSNMSGSSKVGSGNAQEFLCTWAVVVVVVVDEESL